MPTEAGQLMQMTQQRSHSPRTMANCTGHLVSGHGETRVCREGEWVGGGEGGGSGGSGGHMPY